MYGIGEHYTYLELEPFEFPQKISLSDDRWFKNEREFLEFLIRNEWMQRRLGFSIPPSNGLFPDVRGTIFDKDQIKIRVEVEYRAENYGLHGHPFGKADLVLSFIRRPHKKIIRGCPIWSFYVQTGNGKLEYCLDRDINFDFLKYNSDEREDEIQPDDYEEVVNQVEPYKVSVTPIREIKRKRIRKVIVEDKSKPKVYLDVRKAKDEFKIGDWYFHEKKNRLVKIKSKEAAKKANSQREKYLNFLRVK